MSGELKISDGSAGVANSYNLGVGGRIVQDRHLIGSFGNDLAVAHYQRGKRTTA